MSFIENLFKLKIEKSREVLKDTFHRFQNIGIAWSTGKDSTAALFLARKVEPNILVLFCDTTKHFPETYSFRDKMVVKWSLNIINVFPEVRYQDVQGERTRCCGGLKIEALLREIEKRHLDVVITGKRWDEYPDGSNIDYFSKEVTIGDFSHVQVHPLLHWTEKDVDNFNEKEKILSNPIYERGLSTIDCEGCTTSLQSKVSIHSNSANERDRDREKVVERLRALGYW
jgi:3'-phosphoadenosine 5'-phosphosulfate sulfotransferase (PAPS reductase)/FAD synthetase